MSATKKKPRAKKVTANREHRFDCKVNADLFKAANAARTKTWPELVEEMFHRVIGGKVK